MDFADNILSRIDNEAELKKPVNVLICFAKPQTGNALNTLAGYIAKPKSEKSSVTVLNFITPEEAHAIGDVETYRQTVFSDILQKNEKSKITLRTFVKISDDFVTDILKTAEEQHCNLVLAGIGHNVFNPALWGKYMHLKTDPANSETFIYEQFRQLEARSLKNVSTLLQRNPASTGIFVDNGFSEMHNVFVPVLSKEDVHTFIVAYQLALKENVKVMVWDAIGIIDTNAKMQKLFQYMVKKTDGHIYLWDDNKKIEESFIRQQDLVLIGMEGWNKLIASALQWTRALPSTLIVKDKSI